MNILKRLSTKITLPSLCLIDLSEEMQMAGWLYWRIYETNFKKSDFQYRFNTSFDTKYGILHENTEPNWVS